MVLYVLVRCALAEKLPKIGVLCPNLGHLKCHCTVRPVVLLQAVSCNFRCELETCTSLLPANPQDSCATFHEQTIPQGVTTEMGEPVKGSRAYTGISH